MVVPRRPVLISLTRLIAVLLPLLLGGAATVRADEGSLSGERLYRTACAACHGVDGRGAPVSQVGFDTALPDFTDCSFTSREPSADWLDITTHGGPVRRFAELMPAFGEVLSTQQMTAIIRYIKGLCPDTSWPPGELNLPRPLVTEKAFPEDEAVISMAITEGADSVTSKLIYEKRFGARNQVEVVVPLARRDRVGSGGRTDTVTGIGDVAVGVKRALYHSLERGSILSVTGEVILPSGDDNRGLGKGTTIFEPFLTFGQILPANCFVQAQAGLELPLDHDLIEREAFVRLALGRSFTAGSSSRVWSPMVEVLGARELVSGEQTSWDYVPQIQVTLSTRQHIMLNIGARLPITNSSQRSTQVIAYLLWDWFDGGFFDGW